MTNVDREFTEKYSKISKQAMACARKILNVTGGTGAQTQEDLAMDAIQALYEWSVLNGKLPELGAHSYAIMYYTLMKSVTTSWKKNNETHAEKDDNNTSKLIRDYNKSIDERPRADAPDFTISDVTSDKVNPLSSSSSDKTIEKNYEFSNGIDELLSMFKKGTPERNWLEFYLQFTVYDRYFEITVATTTPSGKAAKNEGYTQGALARYCGFSRNQGAKWEALDKKMKDLVWEYLGNGEPRQV